MLRASATRQAITLLLLTIGIVQAGHSAEPSITANQLSLRLGPYLDFVEDESAELTIEDILSSEPSWQRSEQSIPTMGISSSAFWFLIKLTSREAIADAAGFEFRCADS